jgi:hypothetical protein
LNCGAGKAAPFYAFDLIEHDGEDLRNCAFPDGRAALARHDFSSNVRIATLSADIPLEDHFSANAMPHRPCVILTACGSTRQDIRSRPRSPSWCPLSGGWGLVCESPVPALSTGTGYFRRSSRGPQARGGVWGKCAGGQRRAGFRRISTGYSAAKQRCRSVVCRLLDAFGKNVGGVSVVQHPALRRCRDPSGDPESC